MSVPRLRYAHCRCPGRVTHACVCMYSTLQYFAYCFQASVMRPRLLRTTSQYARERRTADVILDDAQIAW